MRIRAMVPSSDAKQPKYRWVLMDAAGKDWLASTDNDEGLREFALAHERAPEAFGQVIDTEEGAAS